MMIFITKRNDHDDHFTMIILIITTKWKRNDHDDHFIFIIIMMIIATFNSTTKWFCSTLRSTRGKCARSGGWLAAGDPPPAGDSRVTCDKNLGTIARITSRLGFQIRDKNNKNLGTITRITSRLGFQIRNKNNKNLGTITRITSRLGFQISLNLT